MGLNENVILYADEGVALSSNVETSKQTTTVTPAYQPVDQTSQQTDQINHLSTQNNPLKQVSNWSS